MKRPQNPFTNMPHLTQIKCHSIQPQAGPIALFPTLELSLGIEIFANKFNPLNYRSKLKLQFLRTCQDYLTVFKHSGQTLSLVERS